jgi:hypothetical protein
MSPVAGPFYAVAALLAVAGLAKLARPSATAEALRRIGVPASALAGRFVGALEVAAAVAAVAVGSRATAVVVAGCYLAFAGFTARLLVGGQDEDCGCFGDSATPASRLHIALNLGAALVAGVAAADPPGRITEVVAAQPLLGVPFVALAALCTWVAYVAFTLLPEVERAAATGRRSPDERERRP